MEVRTQTVRHVHCPCTTALPSGNVQRRFTTPLTVEVRRLLLASRRELEAADRDAKHARRHRAESERLRERAYTIQVRPEE